MTKRKFIVLGKDITEQFKATIEFYGSKNFKKWCNDKGIELTSEANELMEKHEETQPLWEQFLNPKNINLFSVNSIDLLNRMLTTNPV